MDIILFLGELGFHCCIIYSIHNLKYTEILTNNANILGSSVT